MQINQSNVTYIEIIRDEYSKYPFYHHPAFVLYSDEYKFADESLSEYRWHCKHTRGEIVETEEAILDYISRYRGLYYNSVSFPVYSTKDGLTFDRNKATGPVKILGILEVSPMYWTNDNNKCSASELADEWLSQVNVWQRKRCWRYNVRDDEGNIFFTAGGFLQPDNPPSWINDDDTHEDIAKAYKIAENGQPDVIKAMLEHARHVDELSDLTWKDFNHAWIHRG